jgi:PH (Pleckstrin Homology) domain-containing protein
MPSDPPLVIRSTRLGYAAAALFLFLAAIIVLAILFRGSIHSFSDLILAVLVVGGATLLGLSQLLFAAFSRVVVNEGGIEVRNALGRTRRFAQDDITRAARRSVFAPAQAGIYRTELLLIGKDGRCVARFRDGDYDTEDLRRLVSTLGLKWPDVRRSTVRQIIREFPGAHSFDYQTVTLVILIAVLVVLAAIAVLVLFARLLAHS